MRKYIGILGIIAISLMAGVVYATSFIYLDPSAEGTYLQWTPKVGSVHYAMVDDMSCNGQTDYNYTNLASARDSYAVDLSHLPNGMIINQIDIHPCASTNGMGSPSSMRVFYRLNGIDSISTSNYTLTGDTPIELGKTSFTGLSVIKNTGTTLEIGSQFLKGISGARLGDIYTVITYSSSTIVRDTNQD